MSKKSFVFLSLMALLVFTPAAYAANGNGNGNGNGASHGASSSHGNSASNSNGNNTSKSVNNNNNGNNGENSPQNNGNTASGTRPTFRSTASNFSLQSGQVVRFGANNADDVTLADEDFDTDTDDSSGFVTTGTVQNVSDNTFTLDNDRSFTLSPEQISFLTSNGLISTNARVQVIGNHSNNGNVVRILKIQDPTTGQMIMVRLHTNQNVTQASVKSNGGTSNTSSGILAAILTFFQGLFGDNTSGGGTPTPTPSVSPTPSISPTISPTP